MSTVVVLDLPEPPAQSGRKGWRSQWTKTKKAKRATWTAAVQQVRPFHHPPERVRIHAHFRLWAKRDQFNLAHDLKPVIDALKQEHNGRDSLDWRQGVCTELGYFVDDDEAEIGEMTQEINRDDRGVTLTIEVLDEDWEPPKRRN